MQPKPLQLATPPQFLTVETSGARTLAAKQDEHDWIKVAHEVEEKFRQIKLLSLEQVSQLIKESLPPDLLEENMAILNQIDGMLSAAKSRDDIDMQDFERSIAELTSKIVSQCKSTDRDERISIYGGALGDGIFHRLKSKFMVPMLSSFLAQFAVETKDFDHGARLNATKKFLSDYFALAGKARRLIADVTGSENNQLYGKVSEPWTTMLDPVRAWPKWEALVIRTVAEMVIPSWREFKAQPVFLQKDFVPLNDQITFARGNARLHLGRYTGIGGTGRLCEASDHDRADYSFRWSMNGPDDAPLIVRDLTCRHPIHYRRPLAEVLCNDFSAALQLKDNPDELKRTLASIFFDFSHTSTFDRGQASIAEMTVMAIADSMGYALEFSFPAHLPAPDQLALTKFDDREGFIDEARAYLTLRPLK